MSSEKHIEHNGVVLSQDGRHLVVQILSSSACKSCKAAEMCTSSESKTRTIDVEAAEGETYAIGDSVMIEGETSMGLTAVALAYVMPLVIMVSSIVVSNICGASDALAGIIGIVAMVPYFIVLYLMRSRLKTAFTFKTKTK